ncbi:MAG: methyltransferase domain-containing protein [Pararhodobacter sp.]|nr:methyltransferase domain-containing protein [Pararhodobacter sp.]
MSTHDLKGAYALSGPEACLQLYAGWADSYDADFAAGMDYLLPAQVAAAWMDGGGAGPVLDIGAGTGLLAAALRGLGYAGDIDGVDLSAEMLARARTKGLYRQLHRADITRPLDLTPRYGGLVSSGTFTHGHVGPEGLAPLLTVAAPGARFALSVNASVWDQKGFAAAFQTLGDAIIGLDLREVPIYGDKARARDPSHAADRALIVCFRKA